MLKAAVFDDEYIVLQGLREMIDWSSFGIELVGTADNGLSALDLFRAHRPKLIFTDIRMPGMDGLQLIEEIMREAPETLCIVFSGFNEFEYVKRAINLGVADYLEKPITIPTIEQAIRKVLDKISQEQEVLELKTKVRSSQGDLLVKATFDLLFLGEEAEEKWREIYGSGAESIIGVTVLATESDQLRMLEQTDFTAIPLRHGQERLFVCVHAQQPTPEFWEQLQLDSEQADISVGSGRTYTELKDAAHSYKEALRALRSAHFLGEKGIVRFEDLGDLITRPEGLSEREEAIILSLRSGNKAGMLEQIDRYIAWIQMEKLDSEVAEHEMLKLLYLAFEEAKRSSGDKASRIAETYRPHVELREMAARGKVTAWFRSQLDMLIDSTMDAREHARHASVTRARNYMELNYTRDVTLQEVAEHVGMNPTYFSVLFKEEVGESYIKYVTRIRMELAKTLLSRGLKVNDVSEKVGYHTYRHFSEVFKKYTGCTPGQYKDQLANPAGN
ncbi:DNA-binding response regulator [Paenibacillus ferrarius]|uniref:DNA-binding response regulator n=1 Tax=Paenibacillus ferrarius TaxID=1469647 RepID=A0A1V4HM43_9BACL|nr:response regulator [Paenibacillus ferrarius]OPH58080.1 DNA-binding response regulator [Paenibacillus ferrarius]